MKSMYFLRGIRFLVDMWEHCTVSKFFNKLGVNHNQQETRRPKLSGDIKACQPFPDAVKSASP